MLTPHLPIADHPGLLVTTDRQRAAEVECYGCRADYGHRWPHGIIVALITDRSGSEQADCHNDPDCIALAVERLVEDDVCTECGGTGSVPAPLLGKDATGTCPECGDYDAYVYRVTHTNGYPLL